MEDVEIQTKVLLKRLKKNRKHHLEVYQSAFDGWAAQFMIAVEQLLDDLRNKRPEEVDYQAPFRMTRPTNHTDDYDTAIAMLEAEQRPSILLSMHEFRQLHEDDWGWKQTWSAGNSAYTQMV
jgi:hypothetical protein